MAVLLNLTSSERESKEKILKQHLFLSFYKQVFNLAKIPAVSNKYRCEFNFLNDYMHNIDTGCKSGKDYNFDFENNPILAMATVEKKDMLYLYSGKHWLGIELNL